MSASSPHRPVPASLRRARLSDLAALLALEQNAFTTDQLSRRSLRHFIVAPNATLMVAVEASKIAGYILVLNPPRSRLARVYSIAVDHRFRGRGLGPLLLAAAERAARRRRCRAVRLEVHEHNTRAIARYEKAGYRLFAKRRNYYNDHATALRFEKPLGRRRPGSGRDGRDGPAQGSARRRGGFRGGQRGRHSRHVVCFRL